MSGYQYTITLTTTADGTYETGLIDQNHNKCDFRVAFYNSSDAIVTPTAGTITDDAVTSGSVDGTRHR